MKRGKRGQFYIVAAIIISVVLIGLFTVNTYIKFKPKDVKFYDISDEMGLETGYVIDYGIYSQGNLNNLIEEWTVTYVDYSSKYTNIGEWVIIYGNEKNITLLYFTEESSGDISLSIGGTYVGIHVTPDSPWYGKESFQPSEDIIKVKVDDIEYAFDLRKGENFYFVISSEEGDVDIFGEK